MLEAAGGAAVLVDPYDVADIARGIARVLESPDEFRARSLARAGTAGRGQTSRTRASRPRTGSR